MTPRIIACCVLLLAGTVAGCIDDFDRQSAEPVSDSIDDYNDEQNRVVESYCECDVERDDEYDDVDECAEKEGEEVDFDDCERRAAECDPGNFAEYMDCGEDALADYEECIAECPEDSETEEECLSDYQQANIDCDNQISPTLSQAFSECSESADAPSCHPDSAQDNQSDAGDDDPCGEGEVYVELQDGSEECAPLCEEDRDCAQGEECVLADDDGTRVCYPVNQP